MKSKHENHYLQMLPHYIGECKFNQNNIDFEYARETLMKEHDKRVVKRRFERIKTMSACKLCNENEDFPENKEIFIDGFKHIKTNRIGNFF